jgi:hypothetical protein
MFLSWILLFDALPQVLHLQELFPAPTLPPTKAMNVQAQQQIARHLQVTKLSHKVLTLLMYAG